MKLLIKIITVLWLTTVPDSTTYPGEVFTDTADFDAGIRLLLPHYDAMLEAIANCLPATATQVLELGCGTGELSMRVLCRCPVAQLIAVDYSPRMLSYAQAKIEAAGFGRVTWVEADFGNWAEGEPEVLPISKYDACVSSLAIHHLSDATKLSLFRKIHQSLKPGGCFWNADPTPPESQSLASVYQTVREAWTAQQGATLAVVKAKTSIGKPTHGHSTHDHLATLRAHLDMLAKAGFQGLDVPWKYYGLAVFGGFTG